MFDYLTEDKQGITEVGILNRFMINAGRNISSQNKVTECPEDAPEYEKKIYFDEMNLVYGSVLLGPILNIKLFEDSDYYIKIQTLNKREKFEFIIKLEYNDKFIGETQVENRVDKRFSDKFELSKNRIIFKDKSQIMNHCEDFSKCLIGLIEDFKAFKDLNTVLEEL